MGFAPKIVGPRLKMSKIIFLARVIGHSHCNYRAILKSRVTILIEFCSKATRCAVVRGQRSVNLWLASVRPDLGASVAQDRLAEN
jgi:hypothetical protein